MRVRVESLSVNHVRDTCSTHSEIDIESSLDCIKSINYYKKKKKKNTRL